MKLSINKKFKSFKPLFLAIVVFIFCFNAQVTFAKEYYYKDFEVDIKINEDSTFDIMEKHHEKRFRKLLAEVEGNTVFKKEKKVYWVCRKCGYFHEGKEALEECPSCGHPQSYFEVECEECQIE